jgi:geranylgeranyl diphosphate synthase type I
VESSKSLEQAAEATKLLDIRTEFNDLLVQIEDEMRAVLDGHEGPARPLYEMLAYHLGLDQPDGPRGKRMRPLLGLLAYEALTGEHESALPGAAAVELGHNFSLVHDDIEDADAERRHRPTLWAIWGVPLAINAGDALFALSRLALYRGLDSGRISEHRMLELMRRYDETCLALCEGQFLDISFERRTDVTVDEYMEMIGRKTAALISASLEAGAILAVDDPAVIAQFKQFGYDLGLAFQIADDVKGSFWTSAESGKPEAGDIRKRKKTLPLVWALPHAAEPDATRLREIYGADASGPMPQLEVDEVLGILERCGARQVAETEARRWRDIALEELFALPVPSERRAELQSVVDSVITA